jgi:ATP-dependent Clp protease protease subunit
VAKISIKGPIISSNDQWIYDLFGIEATSPRFVNEQLEKGNGEDLEVEINSGGGSVFSGSEIYTSLKSYPGNVTVKIVGIAASAASVIAMAGKKILMSPTAQMMIHNAVIRTSGDYRAMDHMSGVLKNVNQTIANAYKLKSGKSDKELLEMMDKETWLTPQQALENELIDEIMFENEPKLVATINQEQMLPEQVINKIRNMKETFYPTNPSEENPPENQSDILIARLNLLKLRKEDEDE